MMLLSAVALLALPLTAQAQGQGKDRDVPRDPIIAYRVEVMKTLGAQAAALGAIMQKKVPFDQNVALHAEAIALGAREALKAFEPKQPGGAAKPELWDHWADVSARFKALDAAASDLAKAAKNGPVDPNAVLAALTCKSCHDVYRNK